MTDISDLTLFNIINSSQRNELLKTAASRCTNRRPSLTEKARKEVRILMIFIFVVRGVGKVLNEALNWVVAFTIND